MRPLRQGPRDLRSRPAGQPPVLFLHTPKGRVLRPVRSAAPGQDATRRRRAHLRELLPGPEAHLLPVRADRTDLRPHRRGSGLRSLLPATPAPLRRLRAGPAHRPPRPGNRTRSLRALHHPPPARLHDLRHRAPRAPGGAPTGLPRLPRRRAPPRTRSHRAPRPTTSSPPRNRPRRATGHTPLRALRSRPRHRRAARPVEHGLRPRLQPRHHHAMAPRAPRRSGATRRTGRARPRGTHHPRAAGSLPAGPSPAPPP